MTVMPSSIGGHRDDLFEAWQLDLETGERWPSPYYEDDRGGVRYRSKSDEKQVVERPKRSGKPAPARRAPKTETRRKTETRSPRKSARSARRKA